MKAVVNWIEFLLIAHTDRWENEATSYEVIDQQLQQKKCEEENESGLFWAIVCLPSGTPG